MSRQNKHPSKHGRLLHHWHPWKLLQSRHPLPCLHGERQQRNWPTQDAELTIAKCMKIRVYCGKDFRVTAELRKHMRKRYAQRNLTVVLETKTKGCSDTPGWTRTDTPAHPVEGRTTRSQSLTHGADATPLLWQGTENYIFYSTTCINQETSSSPAYSRTPKSSNTTS